MKSRFAFVMTALIAASSPALGERDLIPSLNNEPDVCVDRSTEPEWMQNIDVRKAYTRVLVQDIYRTQNMERILATGTCDCETRFPAWDAAETEFRDRFASTERWEMLEASDAYNRRANALRPEAVAICEAMGNW